MMLRFSALPTPSDDELAEMRRKEAERVLNRALDAPIPVRVTGCSGGDEVYPNMRSYLEARR